MTDRLRALWRRELLYLALALMENCWFYAWLVLLLGRGSSSSPPFVTTLSLLLVSMYLTRLLHARKTALLVQRSLTVVLAVSSALLLPRLYVYAGRSVGNLSWLGNLMWEFGNIMQSISPAVILSCAGLYLWVRGIALAQRDLDVDSVGFSFRFGIVAFVWLFLVGILSPVAANAVRLAFLYFFLGLIAVALGRIESVSQSRLGIRSPFNASWMAILAASTLAVSGVSVTATAVFSLHNIAAVLNALKPVLTLLGKLASPLGVALAWLLQLVITLLVRLFSGLFGEQSEQTSALERLGEELQQFQQAQPVQGVLHIVLQMIKWGLLGLVVVGALAIVAFSIRRVQRALQGENAEQQAVWESGRAEGTPDSGQSRWQRLRDELSAQLAKLRGEDYSLASIRQVYASLVRLATACGFPRRKAETPYEYTATLRRAFASSEEEIQLITEAYVRAHYGERSFPGAYVQSVRSAWLAIRTRQEASGLMQTSQQST